MLLSQIATAQVSLKEFMKSDEVESYAHYFDVKPQNIKDSLNYYRHRYVGELRSKGYYPKDNASAWLIPALNDHCVIMPRQPRIIGKDDEKTTFHHETND
jgi:hypothetical protein